MSYVKEGYYISSLHVTPNGTQDMIVTWLCCSFVVLGNLPSPFMIVANKCHSLFKDFSKVCKQITNQFSFLSIPLKQSICYDVKMNVKKKTIEKRILVTFVIFKQNTWNLQNMCTIDSFLYLKWKLDLY